MASPPRFLFVYNLSHSSPASGRGILRDFDNIGGDCVNQVSGKEIGSVEALGTNLDTDGSCPGFNHPHTYPQLGTLADNRGPTETIKLKPTSPAVDAVSDCTDLDGNPIKKDQRGVSRPQRNRCDVGAYELK